MTRVKMPAMPDPQSQEMLRAAFSEAFLLLRAGRAASAEVQLRALQAKVPGEVNCLRLLGVALLDQDKVADALPYLSQAAAAPAFVAARVDLGRAYARTGRLDESQDLLRSAVAEAPGLESAWLAYGDTLVELDLLTEARQAYERARQADPHRAKIEQARTALGALQRKRAEDIFRAILKTDAGHLNALCGLAAVSLAAGSATDALRLLLHARKQSTHLPLILRGLCQAFSDLNRMADAEQTGRQLARIEPENSKNWVMLGNLYSRLMRQTDAIAAFTEALRLTPREIRLQLSLGHLYKTQGERQASEEAYRRCLSIDPKFSEAYSSLADLKNYEFTDAELEDMQALDRGLAGDDLDQAQLHFALARAYEHRKNFPVAFEHYAKANQRRRITAPYDFTKFETKTERVRRFFSREFFAQHAGSGCVDASPIFVVGLPRSGSTLIEQILASHSKVEGTFELPNMLTMVRDFDHADAQHDAYPEEVSKVPDAFFSVMGERYIRETLPLRTGRPHFIDKMPNNFSHVGLIHAILPQATIIDARRHPMDACFSAFKQYFAEGQSFSYGLEDLGHYYRAYLKLMDHWEHVLPGRVLTVQYEALVRSPEVHIRRLLAHCGLEFEPGCLNFHNNKRAVRTASAEQVRQPLYTSGIGYWRHFESQLAPLRAALGESLERFDDVS